MVNTTEQGIVGAVSENLPLRCVMLHLDLAQQVDEVLHAARPAVALHLLLHLPRQPPQRRRPLPQRLHAPWQGQHT